MYGLLGFTVLPGPASICLLPLICVDLHPSTHWHVVWVNSAAFSRAHWQHSCWGMKFNTGGPLCIQRLLTARRNAKTSQMNELPAAATWLQGNSAISKLFCRVTSMPFLQRGNKLADLVYCITEVDDYCKQPWFSKKKTWHWTENIFSGFY